MKPQKRPLVVTLLIVVFGVGVVASLVSLVSLTFPGSFLEPVWRLNPHARDGFARMGNWSIALMSVVLVSCLLAAIGLWRRLRWGYWLAVLMLVVNLAGDLFNVVSGTEPRAIVGVPIALLLLTLLLRTKTKEYFRKQ